MPSTAIAALLLTFHCLSVSRPVQGSLQPSQQRDLLDLHNVLRSQVSPRPCAPLLPMTWNDRLATVAQSYAERCIWGHNADRHQQAGSEFTRVGENLALTSRTSQKGKESVQAWYDEAKDYDYPSNRCNAKACGHYTQMVWNTSTLLGCGAHVCATRTTQGLSQLAYSGVPNVLMFVCNYSPSGNWRGEHPYSIASTTCRDGDGGGNSGDGDRSSAAIHAPAGLEISVHAALLCCALSVVHLRYGL